MGNIIDLRFVSRKDYKTMIADLKRTYQSATEDKTLRELAVQMRKGISNTLKSHAPVIATGITSVPFLSTLPTLERFSTPPMPSHPSTG